MSTTGDAPEAGPSRREVLRITWPIIVANAATPLLGLADTWVIGRRGTVAELGAIALGSLIFSFVYWTFGFLRMGTTGFVAQAAGARDEPELRAAAARSMLLGVAIGGILLVLARPIELASLALLGGSAEVESVASTYFRIRIVGAPAALATFAAMGALIGLGESRRLLVAQLFLNGLNIGLDLLFAGALGWGAAGVALGTAIAEWATFGLALALVGTLLRERHLDDRPFFERPRILDPARLRATFGANADIMLRTLMLLAGFGWFTHRGAVFGDAVLAANHLLLQIVSFSAFFLDGFAFAAESLVGRAKGAQDLPAFDAAVRRTSELAIVAGVGLCACIAVYGERVVETLTDLAEVRALAIDHLGAVVAYVALSVPAFQLDGVFLGATRTRAMRNAAAFSLASFLGLSFLRVDSLGNAGLWQAFVGYVIVRGLSLAAALPALRRSITRGHAV